jgi:hypothetical protein
MVGDGCFDGLAGHGSVIDSRVVDGFENLGDEHGCQDGNHGQHTDHFDEGEPGLGSLVSVIYFHDFSLLVFGVYFVL